MSVMDQAPDVTPEEMKADAREARIDQAAQNQPEAVVQLETSQEANMPPAEVTSQDVKDLEALQAAPDALDPMLDDRQQKIAVARETAAQASEAMEGVAPGSPEEKNNLNVMREARRANNMTVDGLQSAPAPETPTAPTVEAPATDQEAPASEAPQADKKKPWYKFW